MSIDRILRRPLTRDEQHDLLFEVQAAARKTPWFVPRMPTTGRPFRVSCINFGPLGWCSTRERGYRYSPEHPEVGGPWLPIPWRLLALWREHVCSDDRYAPECCLVNRFGRDGRLGMHVDADEPAACVPVLSISIGDTAVFRLGGPKRSDPSETIELTSGAIVVLRGEDRRSYHGVDKIKPRTAAVPVSADAGRLNFTLRRVTLP